MARGRPPLPIGAAGDISARELPTSTRQKPRWQARVRYREPTGKVAQVARTGQSKADARRRLKTDLAEWQAAHAADIINGGMTVHRLADLWLEQGRPGWSTNTIERYELAVRKQVIPYLGDVRVAELRRSVVSGAIDRIVRDHGPGAAKSVKACLHGMAKLAMRHDALDHNPVADTVTIRPARREKVRALTVAETEDLCDRLRTDRQAVDWDLPDLVEFMLGTGARIGEACATRHSVLADGAGTWEIDATLVRVKGVGMVVQQRPKTAAGWRVLALPRQCVDIADRRRSELRLAPGLVRVMDASKTIREIPNPGVVFTSPGGHLRDPSNTSGDLRKVLDRLGYPWLTSHGFRKTVATRLDEAGLSARVIADQLGHKRPSMTLDVYMGRQVVSATAAAALER